MCISALQQIVDYYQSLNSPVYICYLDASKAFYVSIIGAYSVYVCAVEQLYFCISGGGGGALFVTDIGFG